MEIVLIQCAYFFLFLVIVYLFTPPPYSSILLIVLVGTNLSLHPSISLALSVIPDLWASLCPHPHNIHILYSRSILTTLVRQQMKRMTQQRKTEIILSPQPNISNETRLFFPFLTPTHKGQGVDTNQCCLSRDTQTRNTV